ncbi:MAG: cysS [Parcubacteria group bacterium]|nr:cysS [Parcubacteria group bacterium]
MRFSWEALEASQTALLRLNDHFLKLAKGASEINHEYDENFKKFLNDDLDTPQALALVWKLIKDEGVADRDKRATLLDFDRVLGLNFEKLEEELKKKIELVPEEIKTLAEEREKARKEKNFKKSDELRKAINEKGYDIKDTDEGYEILVK